VEDLKEGWFGERIDVRFWVLHIDRTRSPYFFFDFSPLFLFVCERLVSASVELAGKDMDFVANFLHQTADIRRVCSVMDCVDSTLAFSWELECLGKKNFLLGERI